MLRPKKDPLARQKAQLIHEAIVRYIQAKRPIGQINHLVGKLTYELKDVSPKDLEKADPALEG